MIRPEEQDAFARFQACCPNFAGRAVASVEGPDPPDFLCTDPAGQRVGVELAEWLNERQIGASKRRQRIREGCAPLPYSVALNPTNVGRVCIFPMKELPAAELPVLKAEIETFIQQADSNWSTVSARGDLQQGIPLHDFHGFQRWLKDLRQSMYFHVGPMNRSASQSSMVAEAHTLRVRPSLRS